MNYKKSTIIFSAKFFGALFNPFLKAFNIYLLISIRKSLGDTLCMSALTPALSEDGFNVWVLTNTPSFFENNHHIRKIIHFPSGSSLPKRVLSSVLMQINTTHILSFRIKSCLGKQGWEALKVWDTNKMGHLVKAHLCGNKTHLVKKLAHQHNLKPQVNLTKAEIKQALNKAKLSQVTYIVIFSEAKKTVTSNKGWPIKILNQGISKLAQDYLIIQLGLNNEHPLPNCTDLRGKTNIRETLSIISNAKLVISPEGFANHAAASVNTKCLVLDTGFTSREYYTYPEITSFCQTETKNTPDCAPCWKSEKCPNNFTCIQHYHASHLIDQVKFLIEAT